MLNVSDYVLKAQNTLKNVTNINDILRLIYRYFIDIKQHWLQKNARKNLAYRLSDWHDYKKRWMYYLDLVWQLVLYIDWFSGTFLWTDDELGTRVFCLIHNVTCSQITQLSYRTCSWCSGISTRGVSRNALYKCTILTYYNPDRAQTLISLSMSRHLSTLNISPKSMQAFLSNLAHRQTDRQTNIRWQQHIAPPLSELIIMHAWIIIMHCVALSLRKVSIMQCNAHHSDSEQFSFHKNTVKK